MRLCRVVLTLSLISYITEAQQTPLMQTLNCSTDYESYTACSWSERQEARDLVKMSLFYKENLNLTSMMCNSQKGDSPSQILWSCRINQTNFNTWMKNTFIFKPELELEVQLNASIFDNFRPPPPQKLGISDTKGNMLLTWEAGDGTNRSHWLDRTLDFHITYKRNWEPWEKSSSLWVSNASSCLLQGDKLVPGSTYVARVQSILRQGSDAVVHFSDWSSVITWKTPKDGKVEAQPKNFRCQFNGIDRLKCSWEVRQEVTSSVLFALFYEDNPGSDSEEKECSPVHVENMTFPAHHVLQSCEINVTNRNRQSQYRVTVRPKEEERVMEATMHIKPDPPYNLSVKVLDNQKHRLQWEARLINKVLNIPKRYEISYWKTGKPEEAQSIKDSNSDQWTTFTSEFLEANTHYTAKVRAKVCGGGRDGPWSEWSEELEWATERVFPLWGILLAASTSIILMMAGTWYCQKYLLRKKRKWEATIPRPPRTFLLPGFFQKVQLPDVSDDLGSQNSLEEEGIGCTNISESQMLVSRSEPLRAGSGKIKPHPVASQDMEKTELPGVAKAGQFFTQAVAGDQPVCSHHTQIFDFDGPYIRYGPESSLPDVQQDLDVDNLEMKESSVFLQYVGLPHCLCSQQLPVGNGKGTVPLFSMVNDQVQEGKKQLLPKRQEVFQSQLASGKLEKEENRPQSLPSTNSPCQTGLLDYIATENLSISKERGSLLLLPAVASEEGMLLTCARAATAAAGLPKTTEVLSSSERCQKKPETVFPTKGHSLAPPSASSREAFDDYVLTLPGTPGSVLKEEVPFSMEEPQQGKGFFIFHPDNRSPVFLRQVGDYCFFPDSKTIREASKNPGGTVGGQLQETSQKVTEPPCESKLFGSKLQSISQLCQD